LHRRTTWFWFGGKAVVIDPAKVTRRALQNAASIAALMLTTQALMAEFKGEERVDAVGTGQGGGAWEECTKATVLWFNPCGPRQFSELSKTRQGNSWEKSESGITHVGLL
jgi:hypothetical protein